MRCRFESTPNIAPTAVNFTFILAQVAKSYSKLPKIAKSCKKLAQVAKSCHKLPKVAKDCQRLPKSCHNLSQVATRYHKVGVKIRVSLGNIGEALREIHFSLEGEIQNVKMINGKICKLWSVRFQLLKRKVISKHVFSHQTELKDRG